MKKFLLISLVLLSFCSFAQKRAMTPEDLWRFGRLNDVQLSPDQSKIIYGITNYDLQKNTGNRDIYLLNLKDDVSHKLIDFTGSIYNAVFHPTNNLIYFLALSDNNGMQIFSADYQGANVTQVSNIKDGINSFKFSTDGKQIVYAQDVKLDKTPAEENPDLPLINARIFDDLMYRHWDSWHDYAYSHLFVTILSADGNISAGTDILKNMKFDSPMNPFGGMEQVAWSDDGKLLAYTCKKLTGKEYSISTNSDIYLYDVHNKTTKNITEFNEGYDFDPVFSPDNNYIVWRSMETPGFEADKERIMLINLKTNEVKDLSEGFDQSSHDFKWSKNGDKIYFISGRHAAYNIYELNLKGNKISQITNGSHNYVEYIPAGKFIIGVKQTMSYPNEIFKIDIKTGKEMQITHVNDNLLSTLEMGKVEERWIKTVDDKDMLVWVIYPPFFDENDKYPAILFCQGGPQSDVTNGWSYRWNFQMMAANGYIVMAPNRRGLPTFGQEWNDQISGDYGGLNQQDYLQTVDILSKEPFIDEDRLGAVGASYGGYSVYWLAGNHDKRFKTFISHCGIFNFYSMYGSTEENFFTNYDYEGAYWLNPQPKSYAEFSPHLFANKWDTPILIIVGEHDYRIPYTQSLEAFNCARLQDIPARLLFFNDETHFVLKPQNAVLWQREFKNWLDKYLK
ncbi:MAG: S9 family peptidase [Bacteroidales bacterium]|jgi:dipeptidyl aminopeptidase/acylaminoacyl peptidase|nr:S9 family peptidase [Bacteroidales bacterium]